MKNIVNKVRGEFKSVARGMCSHDYATGYLEALEHVEREVANEPVETDAVSRMREENQKRIAELENEIELLKLKLSSTDQHLQLYKAKWSVVELFMRKDR